MSRAETGYNLQEPSKLCFGCNHWKSSEKHRGLMGGFTVPGRCTLGYCEKQRGKR